MYNYFSYTLSIKRNVYKNKVMNDDKVGYSYNYNIVLARQY